MLVVTSRNLTRAHRLKPGQVGRRPGQPASIPARTRQLERAVVALGLRTETLATTFDRIDDHIVTLLNDLMETRHLLRATSSETDLADAEYSLQRLHGQLERAERELRIELDRSLERIAADVRELSRQSA